MEYVPVLRVFEALSLGLGPRSGPRGSHPGCLPSVCAACEGSMRVDSKSSLSQV